MTPTKQYLKSFSVSSEYAIKDVILLSNVCEEFSELRGGKLNELPIGIFGKKIDINTYILKDNDRIEIYRPLNKTPNQKRLERAKKT